MRATNILSAASFQAARDHGEMSDPEHEVGDLQGLVFELFDMLSVKDIKQMLLDDDSALSTLIEDHSEGRDKVVTRLINECPGFSYSLKPAEVLAFVRCGDRVAVWGNQTDLWTVVMIDKSNGIIRMKSCEGVTGDFDGTDPLLIVRRDPQE